MGAVFRSKDLPSGRKKIIENAIKDFSPDVKNDVMNLLESWEKTRASGLEDKLVEILGQSLFSSIKPRKKEFSNDELEKLQDIFKESLTFD